MDGLVKVITAQRSRQETTSTYHPRVIWGSMSGRQITKTAGNPESPGSPRRRSCGAKQNTKRHLPQTLTAQMKRFTAWKKHTIAEIGKFLGGATPSTAVPAYWNGDIHWTTSKRLGGSVLRHGRGAIHF